MMCNVSVLHLTASRGQAMIVIKVVLVNVFTCRRKRQIWIAALAAAGGAAAVYYAYSWHSTPAVVASSRRHDDEDEVQSTHDTAPSGAPPDLEDQLRRHIKSLQVLEILLTFASITRRTCHGHASTPDCSLLDPLYTLCFHVSLPHI
jgi:hypothetical protein